MAEIALDGVKKYMDTTSVLKNITFLVTEGEKVGIVGENGCGKTTILKLIAGMLKLNHCAGYPYAPVPPGYDEGWVKISRGTTCAYLEQIPEYKDQMKVIDVLNLSFDEIHRMEREMRQLEMSIQELAEDELKRALANYSELVQQYETMGGYETEEKINKICKGLGFSDSFLNQDFNLLSGGEKTTVILGKLLMDTPEVLLLDEPTNHLDMESVEWLEGYIKSYKGIVIIVSHDRYFLDRTVTKIIEVENKECKTYLGNYSDYVSQKEENLRIHLNAFKEQKKKINSMEQSIKELRDWAARADNNKFFRRAASMQIKLDKMERIDKPVIDKQNLKLNITTSDRSGRVVITAEGLAKSFDKKKLFHNAELLVQYGERVALIGPNGSGKTTFLKMLLEEDTPDGGEVALGANIRMAYLPQSLAFKDEEQTALEYFREDITIPEGKAREHLAKFMFFGGNVFKKIKLLSGGEKVRLRLSKLLYGDVNLLILDEPTNHLDTASIESIEEALEQFKGTIFFISHDRYFINKISERVIAIEGQTFRSYLGNYDSYKDEIMKQVAKNQEMKESELKGQKDREKNKTIQGQEDPNRERYKTRSTKQDSSKKDGFKKNKTYQSMAKGFDLEGRARVLEKEMEEIDLLMESSVTDYMELSKLYARKEELEKELDDILETWASM